MKLIVGLGNPEPQYAQSRHNIGYMVVDQFSTKHRALLNSNTSTITTHKPSDGMNNSGHSTGILARRLGTFNEDIIVAFDDMDLEIGQIKVSEITGSRHNGVRSLIEHIGLGFIGVRVGIGRAPDKSKVVEFVLSDFAGDTKPIIDDSISRAVEAIRCVIDFGVEKTMNLYNRSK